MSLLVTLLADILVAILLVATIVSSVRLSRRIGQLKSDETAMRQTIGDLMVASNTAERAIMGLRAALDDCDRTLADRLGSAERASAEIAAHVSAGEGVIQRIGAIVTQMRGSARAETTDTPAAGSLGAPAGAGVRVASQPAPEPASPHGERLGVAAAAALAMSERALSRVRRRAA